MYGSVQVVGHVGVHVLVLPVIIGMVISIGKAVYILLNASSAVIPNIKRKAKI